MRSRQYYKDRVAARIDEANPIGDTVGGQTAIEDPAAYIDDELDYSKRHILKVASVELVMPAIKGDLRHFQGQETEYVASRLRVRSDKSGLIICPEGFIRFISCKLTGWKRELTSLISIRDPEYRYQREETAISGSIQKPVGALYPLPDNEYIADELGKYSINHVFTSNQTVSGLDDTNGSISTGDIFVLNSQTNSDEDGTYLTNGSGVEPTKLSDLHEVISILTFSSVPAYVVGEKVTQATSNAAGKVLLVDTVNNKVVVVESTAVSGTSFNTSNVVTGVTSSATGTPSAQGNYTRGENSRQAIEVFRALSSSDTIERLNVITDIDLEEVPESLSDPIIWHCAARVLDAIGESDIAASFYQKADAQATGYKTGLKGES